MSAVGGMFEARITVPTGGWDVSANGGAGAFVTTVPAGTYYTTELVEDLEDLLNNEAGGTWALTADISPDSTSATGAVTIACSSTFSITWTDPELGQALGHSDIVSAATPQTGDHCYGVWMPACPKWSPYGDAVWDIQSDLVQTVGPSGVVKTLIGTQHEVVEGVRWSHVRNSRAVGTGTPGTWQWFWRVAMLGHLSYVVPGDRVRFTWSTEAGSEEVYLIASPSSSIPQVVDGWTGLYRVEIARMVKV
jgi:hypothetical protein